MSFEEYKTTGNTYFKDGNYLKAVEYYKKCIEVEPENPIGYSNSAMSLIKLTKYTEALESCGTGLKYVNDADSQVYKKLQYRYNLADTELRKLSNNDESLHNIDIYEVDSLPNEFINL
ncbi:hypothetical protein Kpol_1028p51 [Vanderwaltozyma polyspora DSM 70294]|uniref:Uncharacterized protein n=1 Tax=Vanderwaltozyma polyspora (strain ATCC 22028 / DSM 70294 / BCRC 21397 / CBS 2163 / NBRC 10782 / NRRL Y-8283 / UCD 57-17) TaxID=436907 RepID=A7TG19_VANPO|nr:uncharacterized protein Kpol_1028p51 [Vanderwaltozyma polyspora DSM 70294]EDO18776.1 hypothetical protein Kpol_1028p51 [Vanderwaltozyma polyspora DSM 70294]